MKNRFFKIGMLGCIMACVVGAQAVIVSYNDKQYNIFPEEKTEADRIVRIPKALRTSFEKSRLEEIYSDKHLAISMDDLSNLPLPMPDTTPTRVKPTPAPKPKRRPSIATLPTPSPSSASSTSPDMDQTCASGLHSINTACACGSTMPATPAARALGSLIQQDALSAQRIAYQMQQRRDTVDPVLQAELDAASLLLAERLQFEENSRSSRPTSPVRPPMEFSRFQDTMDSNQNTTEETIAALLAQDAADAAAATARMLIQEVDTKAQQAATIKAQEEALTLQMLAQEAREERINNLVLAYQTAQSLRAEMEEQTLIDMVAGHLPEAEKEAISAAIVGKFEEAAARELFITML